MSIVSKSERIVTSIARGEPAVAPQQAVAVVIPAYNEAATIRDIARRARAHAALVIVVDDGSEDDTSEVVSDLDVTVLRNPANRGKGASLMRGARYALERGAAVVVTLDGDGQHAPEDIARLLAMAARHPERVIIGARLIDTEAFPRRRYYANRVANFWISWAAGQPIEDSQSGFRLYPTSLWRRDRIAGIKTPGFAFESEVLIEAARLGYESAIVPIAAVYGREARPSHFRPVVDILRITRMVAWKLICRGLYLQGLYRAFLRRRS